MKKIAVIDSETDPFMYNRVPQPFLWGYYDGDEYHEFKESKDLIDYIKDKEIIIYAHNGGRFDYFFLAKYINLYEPLMIINGRLSKFFIGLAEMRDSYNILPVPLSAYQKTKIDYDIFEKAERYKAQNWKLISDYLKDDCVYLYNFVTKFIEESGNHLTVAGSSMAAWSKQSDCKPPRTTKTYYDSLRPYYYGGRVECFKKGPIDHDFTMIDINSAYPRAMLEQHPMGTTYRIIDCLPRVKDIPTAFLHINCTSKGAFPYRSKDNSISFPRDNVKRDYFITGYEFLSAERNGAIKDLTVIKSLIWDRFVNFADYVHHYYNMRLKAVRDDNKILNILCKLKLNSLYGKFGANPENYADYLLYLNKDIGNMQLEGYDFAGELSDRVIGSKSIDEDKMRYYNIATAASITGYVRSFLFDSLCSVTEPMYCDTDCIVCKDTGKLLIGDQLGEWKVEGLFNKGGIAGKKLYAFRLKSCPKKGSRWKIASKGVKLTYSQIMCIAKGDTIEYKFDAPSFSIKNGVQFIKRNIRMT